MANKKNNKKKNNAPQFVLDYLWPEMAERKSCLAGIRAWNKIAAPKSGFADDERDAFIDALTTRWPKLIVWDDNASDLGCYIYKPTGQPIEEIH